MHMPGKLRRLCPTLQPMNHSSPGPSVHGIVQARILEWVAMPSRDLPDPGIKARLLCLLHWQAGSISATWEALMYLYFFTWDWALC